MKPYLRKYKQPHIASEYPNGTYFEVGFLVSKNASWRSIRPVVDEKKCNGCLQCYLYCPEGVIYKEEGGIAIDYDFCKGCGICKKICRKNAIKMEEEK